MLNLTAYILDIAQQLLGPQASYRLGRALYRQARGDITNTMEKNGELMLQKCVIDAWVASLINDPQLTVFDVGANRGDWSYALLDSVSKQSKSQPIKVYLFEPAPETFQTLKTRLSGFDNLHIEALALSSKTGDDSFYIVTGEATAGTNSLYCQDFNASVTTIMKTTVASYCAAKNIEKVHLLKCDTEGHDMEVIRGAMPLLESGMISVLQFEYNQRWIYSRNFLRDVFEAVKSMPYKVAKLQSDHLLVFDEWHFEMEKFFEGNYALIHNSTISWFPAKKAKYDHSNILCITDRI